MGVADSAARLFELLAGHGDQFTRYLRPGLSDERIAELTTGAGLPAPPPDVVDFYRHFDVEPGYAYGPDQPTFYGIYWLLGIEDAVDEWQRRRSYDFMNPIEQQWFPIIAEGNNQYLVDHLPGPDGAHPIISSFYAMEPAVEFRDLTAMFDTLFAWADSGAVPVVDGHVAGDYDGDPARVREIAARLNPGVAHWTDDRWS
jgi:hypothetical protein